MLLHNRKHTPDGGTTALKSALRVSALAAFIGMMSTGASAGTVVTEWAFTLDSGFTAWTQTGEVPPVGTNFGDVEGYNNNPLLNAPSLLRWGLPQNGSVLPADQSGLEVGAVNGHFDSVVNIMTDIPGSLVPPASAPQAGNVVPTVQITHYNNPLAASANMNTATLVDVLTLLPVAPPGVDPGPHVVPPLAFMIKFAETQNSPNEGGGANPNACADTTSPAGSGCNDIFVLDVPLAAFDPSDASLNQQFVFDDFLYNAKIQLEGLGPIGGTGLRMLTDAECAAADPTFVEDANPLNNCIGLTTIENMQNDFQAFLSIQLVGAVAEPGPLAIFGLGLAGLGFMRRRRQV